jgi:hypothetical protein
MLNPTMPKVLPTALQTTLIPDGEQTPEGVTGAMLSPSLDTPIPRAVAMAGLLNTADLLDKIAQLQARC